MSSSSQVTSFWSRPRELPPWSGWGISCAGTWALLRAAGEGHLSRSQTQSPRDDMLYYLSQFLQERSVGTDWAESLSFLRVFRYITVRSAGAAVSALVISWCLGPVVIAWLKDLKFGQNYQDKAEET